MRCWQRASVCVGMASIFAAPGSPAALSIKAIAAGGAQSLAVAADGTVWEWGARWWPPLVGAVNVTPPPEWSRPAPGQVSGLSGVVAVAAGWSHSLAAKGDGTVWAWGGNEAGQLGDGTRTPRPAPVQVSGLSGVTAVAAGWSHCLALKGDGTVWSWGNDNSPMPRLTPVQAGTLSGVVAVAAGNAYSLALKNDGTVWGWGFNRDGRLGDGTTTDQAMPAPVRGLTGVIAIAAGASHSLALKRDGTVWAWGWNYSGQLGDGTNAVQTQPVQVRGLVGVVAIAAGYTHSLAMKGDGTVWAWGKNDVGQFSGQLGDGTSTSQSTPVQVSGLREAVAIAAGGVHSLALKGDGTILAWGSNQDGQLGDGTPLRPTLAPVSVLGGVAAVAVGPDYSLALKDDGTVWYWGLKIDNGSPLFTPRSTPVQVNGLSGVKAIAAGIGQNLALTSDGTVWEWGERLWPLPPLSRSAPSPVSGVSGVVATAAGGRHNLALKSDGTVWAWGNNDYGQLGDGTTTQRATPVQVGGLSGVVALAAGGFHSLALRADGTVWAWGDNDNENEYCTWGSGTATPQLTPVQVTGLSGVVAVAASRLVVEGGLFCDHNLALKSDGTMWAWGANFSGQLGDGTTTDRSDPVRVNGLEGAVSLAAGGGGNSLAARSDGTVWAWGGNYFGQLGDGTTTGRLTPGKVGGLAGVVAVAGASEHSLALMHDGTVWAWGGNEFGQLGYETATNRTTPVQVVPPGSPDLAVAVSHGGDFAVGSQGVYTLTITNVGPAASGGAITVTDSLPPGVAFVSASGTDWTCAAVDRTVTCINAGPVAPGASRTITLTVDVGSAASPGVMNPVSVSSQSDLNISNNSAWDPTVVWPARTGSQ